jgi:hypothetical protein
MYHKEIVLNGTGIRYDVVESNTMSVKEIP